jgi:hypothetical protein
LHLQVGDEIQERGALSLGELEFLTHDGAALLPRNKSLAFSTTRAGEPPQQTFNASCGFLRSIMTTGKSYRTSSAPSVARTAFGDL